MIRKIKDHAKKVASPKGSDVDHAVGTTIYYAAIASALAFHGQKITTHSFLKLDRSFAALAHKTWITPELAGLFSEACKRCQAKLKQDGEE